MAQADLTTAQSVDVSTIIGNLLRRSLVEPDLNRLFDAACNEMAAAGLGISRAHITVSTLHPLFKALSHTWVYAESTETRYYAHAPDADGWVRSPFYFMISHGVLEMRRHLAGPEALLDMPVLEEFAQAGYTDYRGYLHAFESIEDIDDSPEGLAGSWCTSLPGGFTSARLAALREVELASAVVCKLQMKSQMTDNILHTYLGADAGRQVLSGRIKRGDVESVNAVIWYSDMRGSTELASKVDGREFLNDINDYFSCTAGAVLESGGEVLRFIGDAVLAIFPVRDDQDEHLAMSQATRALALASAKMKSVNRERVAVGKDELSYGVALHYGEVLFGNIGAPERLEFSVVGEAANEVARIEEMTKHLGHSVLLSGAVANRVDVSTADLGEQPVRGSGRSLRVYGVSDDSLATVAC
jgi:adenylate cyclase